MAPNSSPPPSPSPSPHSATTTTTTVSRESFLSRKKREIVEKSMAFFQLSLDRCLDNSSASAAAAAAAAGGGGSAVTGGSKRRAKRGREEVEEDGNYDGGVTNVAVGGGAGGEGKAKKKKGNPKEVGDGKRFACPFCRHDPGKYRNVKTCCGPGWEDVHRVKEHVYRRHSLKNFCPRCFERFDEPEALKKHQRADVPCKLREKASDAITEEQEKALRARAKSHCSEEAKWQDMYRAIFPGEKIPSPYYDSDTDASHPKSEKSRFQNVDECKAFLRTEISRLVKPAIEHYVHTLLEQVQEKVDQKTLEIICDVETKVLRTFRFQEEQALPALAPSSAAATAPHAAIPSSRGHYGAAAAAAAAAAEPSPPPSPEIAKVSQMLEGLKGDPIASELCAAMHFDLEDLLAGNPGFECDAYSADSAYWTLSSSGGGQGQFGMDGAGFPSQYFE